MIVLDTRLLTTDGPLARVSGLHTVIELVD